MLFSINSLRGRKHTPVLLRFLQLYADAIISSRHATPATPLATQAYATAHFRSNTSQNVEQVKYCHADDTRHSRRHTSQNAMNRMIYATPTLYTIITLRHWDRG